MKRISKKKAAHDRECKPFRTQLVRDVGHCEICGHDPTRVKWGNVIWPLEVHEIARGIHRDKALDKPYAVLVACRWCHMDQLSDPAKWPQSRQLAALKRSRPADYDLAAFNSLIGWGRDRITESDVNKWEE